MTSFLNQLRTIRVWNTSLQQILQELFRVSIITYFGLLVAEGIRPGLVTFSLDLDWFLGFVIIAGIASNGGFVVNAPSSTRTKTSIWMEWSFLSVIALVAIGLSFMLTQMFGRTAGVVAASVGVVVVGILWMGQSERSDRAT